MKLKTAFQDENFKLGEVADVSMATIPNGRIVARATAKVGGEHTFYYDSLEAVYNDWKDYEEPKEYWYINASGDVNSICEDDENPEDTKVCIEIGNYFSSREEAELAVRKLKAWKRLKDKGFRFTLTPSTGSLDITPGKFQIEITADMPEKWFCCDAVQEDLDDCFGGEE